MTALARALVTRVGQGDDHSVQWDRAVLETAVILEGELGPLEGSMKPLTLMASEDGDGDPENWQQKKRSCGYGDRQSHLLGSCCFVSYLLYVLARSG